MEVNFIRLTLGCGKTMIKHMKNAWVLILIEKTQMILNIFLTYDYTAITLNSLPCIQILRDLIFAKK